MDDVLKEKLQNNTISHRVMLFSEVMSSLILCNQALACFPMMHCGCPRMPLPAKEKLSN